MRNIIENKVYLVEKTSKELTIERALKDAKRKANLIIYY